MEEDEVQTIQRNVEKDLFDEQGKIMDRFYSLMLLTFTIFGFTITALSFLFGRGVPNILEALGPRHISFSFFCMLMAFLISIFNLLVLFHHRRLVHRGGMIRYREGNELINNNLKLYRSNARHKNFYVIAITFIGLALTSFFNSFAQHHVLTLIITIGFVVVVVFLVINTRRNLS
jgi:FtsH-binding integral membrane protein